MNRNAAPPQLDAARLQAFVRAMARRDRRRRTTVSADDVVDAIVGFANAFAHAAGARLTIDRGELTALVELYRDARGWSNIEPIAPIGLFVHLDRVR